MQKDPHGVWPPSSGCVCAGNAGRSRGTQLTLGHCLHQGFVRHKASLESPHLLKLPSHASRPQYAAAPCGSCNALNRLWENKFKMFSAFQHLQAKMLRAPRGLWVMRCCYPSSSPPPPPAPPSLLPGSSRESREGVGEEVVG